MWCVNFLLQPLCFLAELLSSMGAILVGALFSHVTGVVLHRFYSIVFHREQSGRHLGTLVFLDICIDVHGVAADRQLLSEDTSDSCEEGDREHSVATGENRELRQVV